MSDDSSDIYISHQAKQACPAYLPNKGVLNPPLVTVFHKFSRQESKSASKL